MMLLFKAPLVRLLAPHAIANNPGFWNVKDCQDAAEKFVICFDDLYICEEEMLLGIDDTFASSVQNARQRGVYRLDGTRVDDTQKLQKGIYIIDGRKTVVK